MLLPQLTMLTNSAIQYIAKSVLPPLLPSSTKGSSGHLLVIGGSPHYNGAPVYSALSALRTGVDLVSLITLDDSTASVIKSKSNEIMCRSIESSLFPNTTHPQLEAAIFAESSRPYDAVVIGPGLGRRDIVKNLVHTVVTYCEAHKITCVIDADGIWALLSLSRNPSGSHTVLTPNIGEFCRIAQSVNVEVDYDFLSRGEEASGEEKRRVAVLAIDAVQRKLNVGAIVLKGYADLVCVTPTDADAGENVLFECTPCPPINLKRCGGIGDVLSGAIGAFLAFENCKCRRGGRRDESKGNDDAAESEFGKLDKGGGFGFGCWAACHLVKRASGEAFEERGRGMSADDVLSRISGVVKSFDDSVL